jgi:hypothetical protein
MWFRNELSSLAEASLYCYFKRHYRRFTLKIGPNIRDGFIGANLITNIGTELHTDTTRMATTLRPSESVQRNTKNFSFQHTVEMSIHPLTTWTQGSRAHRFSSLRSKTEMLFRNKNTWWHAWVVARVTTQRWWSFSAQHRGTSSGVCHRRLAKLDYDPTVTSRELQLIVLRSYWKLQTARDYVQRTSHSIPHECLAGDGTDATPCPFTVSVSLPKGGDGMAPLRDGEWPALRSCRLNLSTFWRRNYFFLF